MEKLNEYSQKIWTVDAFVTSSQFSGNPAGVMIVKEFPKEMGLIAAEMNLAETAFVKVSKTEEGPIFHIRWFTPTVEVRLCGHATLAAAQIIFQENLMKENEVTFQSLSGPLRVLRDNEFLALDFPIQKIGEKLSNIDFEKPLNLRSSEIDEVLRTPDDILVIVSNDSVVKGCNPDLNLVAKIDSRGVIVSGPNLNESLNCDFVSRFFAPQSGVSEDPVTGSAHCALADYWSKRLNKSTLEAKQISKRGGNLNIQLKDDRYW
jgi:PhzF family phenazine biosynthesis protein